MLVLIIATLLLILFYAVEYRRHRRNIYKIPVRIHVNGTRGKSSVTRLIAAGLRAGGKRTIAKTTGTLPRMILEDGSEASIERLGPTNIIEQKYIFRNSVKRNPEVLVIECMAVNPVYQWIAERMIVKATIGVITNSRLDHIDLMGSTLESITQCLCNTMPPHGIMYTAEIDQFPLMKKVADRCHTNIVMTKPDEITTDDLRKFHYIEHAENVALALAVCKEVGVDRDVALKGMQDCRPDPGALKRYRVEDKGKTIFFYNVFAANDPDSTKMIWKMLLKQVPTDAETMIVLNGRADRYFRSIQLTDICVDLEFSHLILTGERTDHLLQYAKDKIPHPERVIAMGEADPEILYQKIFELTKREAHIAGIGNIAGARKYGAQIVKCFKTKSQGGLNG
jgi:poly-gamma-glutamate synthase PgsB/CapB